jgi:hypothetical protein
VSLAFCRGYGIGAYLELEQWGGGINTAGLSTSNQRHCQISVICRQLPMEVDGESATTSNHHQT